MIGSSHCRHSSSHASTWHSGCFLSTSVTSYKLDGDAYICTCAQSTLIHEALSLLTRALLPQRHSHRLGCQSFFHTYPRPRLLTRSAMVCSRIQEPYVWNRDYCRCTSFCHWIGWMMLGQLLAICMLPTRVVGPQAAFQREGNLCHKCASALAQCCFHTRRDASEWRPCARSRLPKSSSHCSTLTHSITYYDPGYDDEWQPLSCERYDCHDGKRKDHNECRQELLFSFQNDTSSVAVMMVR